MLSLIARINVPQSLNMLHPGLIILHEIEGGTVHAQVGGHFSVIDPGFLARVQLHDPLYLFSSQLDPLLVSNNLEVVLRHRSRSINLGQGSVYLLPLVA